MNTTKQLYRELAKAYHPDKSTNQAEYDIFGQLMVAINEAAELGDVNTLEQIKALGPVYLAVKMYAESEFSGVAYQGETSGQDIFPKEPLVRQLASVVGAVLCLLHPYALWFVLENWPSLGPVRKLTAFFTTVGWTVLFVYAWELLDRASVICANAGYPHESWVGLVIVLLRGGVILATLPCLISLVAVGFFAAMIVGLALLANYLASAILGLFHPLLARLPAVILVPLGVWVFWRLLCQHED